MLSYESKNGGSARNDIKSECSAQNDGGLGIERLLSDSANQLAPRSLNTGVDWPEKGGSRAEVRRERKKRDILSPANVL